MKKIILTILAAIVVFFAVVFTSAFILGGIHHLLKAEKLIGIAVLFLALILLTALIVSCLKKEELSFLAPVRFELFVLGFVMFILSFVLLYKH